MFAPRTFITYLLTNYACSFVMLFGVGCMVIYKYFIYLFLFMSSYLFLFLFLVFLIVVV